MTNQECIEVLNHPQKHIGLYNGELTYDSKLVETFEKAIKLFEDENERIKIKKDYKKS